MNVSNLLEWQGPAAAHLLEVLARNGAAMDASDLGTGKTFTAGAVIRHLNVPTLAVVPAVSVSGWKWMANHLGVEFDIQSLDLLRNGGTPWGGWENPRPKKIPNFFQCESCQVKFDAPPTSPCPARKIHCLKTCKQEHKYGKFNWHPGIKFLVVDEIHRCGGLDSLQSDMLIAAKRQKIPTLMLSATPCDSPLGLRALGYVLGLHELVGPRGFYTFAMRRGCKQVLGRGLQWWVGEEKKQKAMVEIHHQIFPSRGVRVRIADLGDKFPKCSIRAELCNLSDPGRIDQLYRTMAESLAEVHDKREKGGDTALENLLRARMELELLKLPVFEELTAEAIAARQSVAVFLNFRASVLELARRLKTACVIIGGQSPAERESNMNAFQADAERVIVCSPAGGIAISLHDTHGNFPRLGLVNLGFSARETRQTFGRLPRAGGKTPVQYRAILCGGTVEERIHKVLREKLNNLDSLLDEDLFADNLPLDDTKTTIHEALAGTE